MGQEIIKVQIDWRSWGIACALRYNGRRSELLLMAGPFLVQIRGGMYG